MNTELLQNIGIAAGSAGILLSLAMMFVRHRKQEDKERERYVRSKEEERSHKTYTSILSPRPKVSH